MISALRTATVSSHDDASQAKSAGQPEEHLAKKRLVRSYWLAVTLGTVLSILLLLFSGTAAYYEFTSIGVFYAVVVGNIVFILRVLRTYRKHYEAANKACCTQMKVIEKLGQDNIDLQYEVEYWKAISFTKRGGLTVVKEDTAAGTPVSEKHQDVSAAVVEFPKGAGA